MEMEKQKKTVRLGLHTPGTHPTIVGEVKKSIPRMRAVKPKERIQVTTSNKGTTTCETSGNRLKLCVNLMPVLASAKEPVEEQEEEEEEEEEMSCKSEAEPKTSSKKDPFVTKQTFNPSDSNAGLTLDRAGESKRTLNPLLVLPPITQPAAAPECCDHRRTRSFPSPLPPITSPEKTTTTTSSSSSFSSSPNVTTEDCGGDAAVTGRVSLDRRPWMDNVLFSNCRSAEFRLPDISLSSLDALLQTVTQKLARKRRGGGADEEDKRPWARVQTDHLLVAVRERRLREKRVDPANIEAATETSAGRLGANRQRSLRPKPTLVLRMTKKDLLTDTVMQ